MKFILRRIPVSSRFITAIMVLLPALYLGQTKTYSPSRTPDGKPDLQGTWTNVTVTPLERPANQKDKPFFTPQEATEFEKQTVDRNNADRRDGGADADVGRAYNDAW